LNPFHNLNSCLYQGETFHQRFVPKKHKFNYTIMMFWLDLDELNLLDEQLRLFSKTSFNWIRFKRQDFLKQPEMPLKTEALQTMSRLAGKNLKGKVYLLSPLRILGMYFSPVNFYYLQSENGTYSHLLAEVSNTPWNERHCYLVDLAEQQNTQKEFHVSPFNPVNMKYQWHIKQPGEKLQLKLDCLKESKHFSAAIALHRTELNNHTLGKTLIKFPHMTIKTVWGIYWEALKLLIKRMPIYDHPGRSSDSAQ